MIKISHKRFPSANVQICAKRKTNKKTDVWSSNHYASNSFSLLIHNFELAHKSFPRKRQKNKSQDILPHLSKHKNIITKSIQSLFLFKLRKKEHHIFPSTSKHILQPISPTSKNYHIQANIYFSKFLYAFSSSITPKKKTFLLNSEMSKHTWSTPVFRVPHLNY